MKNLGNFLDEAWPGEGTRAVFLLMVSTTLSSLHKMVHLHPNIQSSSIQSDTFHTKTTLNTEPRVASQLTRCEISRVFSQLPFCSAISQRGFSSSSQWKESQTCVCICSGAYPSRLLHNDLNANFGLLVLVDQTHQLLSILRLHQHDGTGKGVCFSQLCVVRLGWLAGSRKRKTQKCECDIFVCFFITDIS